MLARGHHLLVPRYDVSCARCGVDEVFAPMSAALERTLQCASCGGDAQQVFSAESLPGARIDAGGEDAPLETRRRDGTAIFNMGLPGVETVVGTRADGKPKLAYRPLTNHEVGSNRNARELAKRSNLVAHEEHGRYRSVVR
jgi:hypothetical protein